MALPEQAQQALTARYMARQERLAMLGGRALAKAWMALPGFDEANIAQLEALATPLMNPILDRVSALSIGHVSTIVQQTIPAVTATPVAPDWRGPFTNFWASIGRGEEFGEALLLGESRADAAGRTSVVSTARQAADLVESDDIVGWRRITDADPCPWCITVATQVYKSAASADFGHSRCGCGVAPITR